MVDAAHSTIVLGHGFLGKAFEKKGFEVWGRDRFELAGRGVVGASLPHLAGYDTIINCIAKSNTRWCEKPENFCEAIWSNGDVPRILSNYCAAVGKQFVHISTGCLYDSGLYPYTETDFMTTHCNYTVSKWIGEKGLHKQDLVLRPRLLFGDFVDKGNLLCKLPKFTHFLRAYNSYISVNVLVDAIMALLEQGQSGIFNAACDGVATVKELADAIGLEGVGITEGELHEREHLYLVNNVMDLTKLKQFYQPPDLMDEIKRCWEALQ